MKEKRIKRKWQRLLATAVLLLSVVIQAQADVRFVPVDAGWDGEKWWVDVKNVGSDNFAQTDGIKLGIYFKVCNVGTTTENGNNTGTWNDETTWSINSGETLRFYANGGKQGATTSNPNFDELSGNTTYTLEIEVYNHDGLSSLGVTKPADRFGTVNFTLSADKNSVNIIESTKNFYGMNEGGLFDVTIDGKTVSVYQLRGTGLGSDDNNTASEYNRPKKLVKDNWYYFGEAPVGEYATRSVLWDKYIVDGKTIFMFKGITAYYRIQKITGLSHRKDKDDVSFTTHTFLKVEPLNGEFTEVNWNKIYTERTKEFQDRDKMFPSFSKDNNDETWGYGCLYIAGSPGFGYGEYDKYVGWGAQWEPDGYDKNFILADNQMWVPSPEKNLYKFRLQGGGNISNDKSKGFEVKFYLHNYLKKYTNATGDNETDNWKNYERLSSWRGGNVNNVDTKDAIDIDEDYPYLMHLPKSRDFFEITTHIAENGSEESLYSPDWKNGNFRTRTIGFDSDTPALPEGYIFEITIDLRDKEPETWKEQSDGTNGIEVKVERIKDEFALGFTEFKYTSLKDNQGVTNEDIKFIDEGDNSTSCEVYLSKFNKNEIKNPNRNITKRIKLRDALRFDYGIPFADQYTTAANTDDIIKFNNLIIHGALSDDDMQYLSWLSRNNKLVNLDLTDAILPNGVIPGPQTIDNETNMTDFGGNSETLEKVTMPTNGVKGIGNNAFKGCTGLTNMAEIVKRTHGTIGESAFAGCTNPASTVIDVETITSIGENAFKNCSQIVKFKVPASVNVDAETPDITFEGYGENKPSNVGNDFKAGGIKVSGTTAIEAEDFNSGNGTGYNHSDKQGEGENNYRGDTNKNYGIKNKDNFHNKHDIGYNTQEDWYNYTFYVENDGIYTLTAHIGSGQNDDVPREIKATFDGNNDAISFTLPKNEQTAWDGTGIKEKKSDKELLFKKGWHYMKIDVVTTGIELDYYTLNYVRSAEINDSPITDALHANSFEGINPNNCEVEFTGEDATNNYAAYREQAGWMSLLTKTLDENAVYSCVNQHHANVKMKKAFKAYTDRNQHHNNWYSIVLPFDADATTLINAKTNDGKYVFDRAAYFDSKSFDREGYPNVHFSYFDGTPFLAKVNVEDGYNPVDALANNNTYEIGDKINGTEELVKYITEDGSENGPRIAHKENGYKSLAGYPFIVRIDAIGKENNVKFYDIKFEDVRIYPSDDKKGRYSDAEYDWHNTLEIPVNSEDNQPLYSFKGNLKDPKLPIENGNIYYLSGKWYHGGVNPTLPTIRSYFEPNSPKGAALIKRLVSGGTTDIININVADNADGNIYNLNGQLVRKGTSVEGLPKGIFIVNGKRVIIK